LRFDWPVYPRLKGTMRASVRLRNPSDDADDTG
jgi:hypothetical protein